MWHIRLGSPFSEAILQETNIAVFSLNSESCIWETPLQQETEKANSVSRQALIRVSKCLRNYYLEF